MFSRAQKGFSLIETMVVLVIVAIVVSLVSFNISYLGFAQAQHELSLLHARMHALQQIAVASGAIQSMDFSLAEQGYIWEGNFYKLPKKLRFGIKDNIKGPPSHPREAITSPITFSESRVLFHPDGIIKPGTVYLLDHRNQLYALSCGVSHVSFLRKYRYDGKWKLIDT